MKTIDEIKELKEAIEGNLKQLPDFSMFGDDNTEDKEQMQAEIDDLELILDGRLPKTVEIKSWYVGNDDCYMGDYLK